MIARSTRSRSLLLVLTGLLLWAPVDVADADEVTCRTVGHYTRCDDGTTFRHHGNRITDDEGKTWRRRPNGDVVDPDGEVRRRLIGPDGQTCRKSGNTVQCSD
jgi:hypothetical protein